MSLDLKYSYLWKGLSWYIFTITNDGTTKAIVARLVNINKLEIVTDHINLINTEIDIYKSITKEEIRDIAKKYLNPNQRVQLEYLPKEENKK